MVSPPPAGSIKPDRPAVDTSADTDSGIVTDPASLLPDPPPVPSGRASLVGGTIETLDRVRDQITISVFGGGRMKILIDPRTRVYQGSTAASIADLRQGQRAYVDTILDGTTVFAKSIRLKTTLAAGESEGVVLQFKRDRGELILRDAISPAPLHVRLLSSTRITQADRTVADSVLVPGSLIAVKFDSRRDGDAASEIAVLALPGIGYTFTGQVTHLDLRTGLLVLNSATDHKTYEVYFDPSIASAENVHSGDAVTATANFDGSRYVVRSLTIAPSHN